MNPIVNSLAEQIKLINEKEVKNIPLSKEDYKTLFLFSLLKESENGSKQ